MTDIWSRKKRSEVMALIRSKDTTPELKVRSALWRAGLRFTVNGPRNRTLPGKPDIVLVSQKMVVFVHGCFWHAHGRCKIFRMPKTRTEWWRAKLEGNKARDRRNSRACRRLGWNVVVIWECQVDKMEKAADGLLGRLLSGGAARQPARSARSARSGSPISVKQRN